MAKRNTRRPRRHFTAEFKADAVKLCKVGDRTTGQVAADLDLTETSLREWLRRADVEAEKAGPEVLAMDEREDFENSASA